jgi:steroid delta-isomerase-like uncharacterized protein
MGLADTQRLQHQMVNDRDVDRFREIMRADVVYEDVPAGRTVEGVDELKEWLGGWFTAVPDIRIGIEEGTYLEGPGFALAMVRGRGRHDGPFGPIPATGRPVDFPAWELLRFDADGKVASGALMYDQLMLLTQLGVAPPAA